MMFLLGIVFGVGVYMLTEWTVLHYLRNKLNIGPCACGREASWLRLSAKLDGTLPVTKSHQPICEWCSNKIDSAVNVPIEKLESTFITSALERTAISNALESLTATLRCVNQGFFDAAKISHDDMLWWVEATTQAGK